MTPIMLVSADRELARVLKLALRETQARVHFETADIQAAADHMAQHPATFTVVDYFLPRTSGLEALKTIKRVNESALVLFLARVRTRGVLERAFRLGAQDVMAYPTSMELIRDTIMHRLEAEPLSEIDDKAEAAAKAAAGKAAKKK